MSSYPSANDLAVLRRLRDLVDAGGGAPVPIGDLYGDPRESAQVYTTLRGLEDRSHAVYFEFRENPADPWGNRHQYIGLTQKGRALLADAIEEEAS